MLLASSAASSRLVLAILLGLGLFLAARDVQSEETLPVGSHPPALEHPHFPDRLHAFVWRNWQLVPAERLAEVLETSPDSVRRIAASMGLPADGKVEPHLRQRGYITLIRRNWHLLPYDQLLQLLGMTADELAFALREDDFLFIKLGSLKPKCERLVYSEPTEAARRRAAEIKQLIDQQVGAEWSEPAEPRFQFIEELTRHASADPRRTASKGKEDDLRFIYSYFGTYGDPLSDPALDPYPDGLLARLSEVGVNGVWLHVVLRQLAPGGEHFPEFGEGREQRLANLRRLVERAQRHGIRVYLYMNEPRAMPAEFFDERPEMAGVREGDFVTMCTSDPLVRQWLEDALAHVFHEVPGLGGVFTITASENLTHCWSHFQGSQCPRCSKRTEAEVVAEVNRAIAQGVHRSNPEARVLAWDWGWNRHGDASDTIRLLPSSVWLMSVSEWSKPVVRGGVATEVGEYSISAVGPGPRAKRHWQLADELGLKTAAKVQFNTTWELSSVPYLPVLELVAEHCRNLAQEGIDGMMLSWTVGSYPSPNLRVAQLVAEQPEASIDQVLTQVATERYGGEAADQARAAWRAFSQAFREYPLHIAVLYQGPQQMGPANLLAAEPTGFASTMVGLPYDDLHGWRGPYPPEVLAAQFAAVASGWTEGLTHLRKVVEQSSGPAGRHAEADLRVAEAAALHFASAANQVRFIALRDKLLIEDMSDGERAQLRGEMQKILDDEIRLARRLFTIARQDSRIGFEAANHYYYVPHDLLEKIINCEHLRANLSAGS